MPDYDVEDGEDEEDAPRPERRHRKKRKEPRKLDDEDIDLIQENTGKSVKRLKRLQKVSEKERTVKDEVDEDSKEDERLFSKQPTEELIDTSRKRIIATPRGNADEEISNGVFEDPRTLGARVKSNKAQAKPKV